MNRIVKICCILFAVVSMILTIYVSRTNDGYKRLGNLGKLRNNMRKYNKQPLSIRTSRPSHHKYSHGTHRYRDRKRN